MGVIQHGEELAYGISSNDKQQITVAGVPIFPTRVSISKEGEVKQYKGPAGTVISLVIPEQFDQLSVEGYIPAAAKTAAADIKKGDVCDISGLDVDYSKEGSLRLESWSVNWSNEDVAQVSCTIRQYPSIDAEAGA
jgi:hypothetical protein